MMNTTKPSFFEYALLTFLILWSGGGFTYGLFPFWMLYALPIVGAVFLSRKCNFSIANKRTLVLLAVVLVLQIFKFNGAPISIVSPFLTIVVCMMSAILLKESFTKIFVNIIYFFAISSLIIWIINLMPGGNSLIENIAKGLPQLGWDNLRELDANTAEGAKSIYLYTIRSFTDSIRNPGPFWEPGRFSIFLTIALAVNLFYHRQEIFNIKSLTIFIANLTTFSTTGYSAVAIVMIVYVLGNKKIGNVQKLSFSFLLVIIATYVWQLEFMADKVNEQFSQVDVTYSRFGAIFYHWTQIKESPLIGYGPYLSLSVADLAVSPNGLTDLIRYYGIPVALFLYILLYKGTATYLSTNNMIARIGVFVSILFLCFSQTITYSPFFYLLYFIGLNNSQYETTK